MISLSLPRVSFISISVGMLLSTLYCSAQSDLNYQDTRTKNKNESFAKLRTPNLRTDLATFTLAGIGESVGTTDLLKIPPSEVSNNLIGFDQDGIKASIQLAPFDTAGHKFTYDDNYVIKIDKKTYFGNYGFLPKTHIQSITLTMDGDTVEVPPSVYADIFNVSLTYNYNGTNRTGN
ncbi:MAG: hypothetical protein ABI208_10360, partial [Ginsengibacter sp.]